MPSDTSKQGIVMNDPDRLDAIASRMLTAQRANRGARHLANAAVELGEPVEAASVAIILDEYRQAYREVHRVLTSGDPDDILYLVARMDPTGAGGTGV
jgi:RNA-splicing ligase RtcB